MTDTYEFSVQGIGRGNSIEEAWNDCKEALNLDKMTAFDACPALIESDNDEVQEQIDEIIEEEGNDDYWTYVKVPTTKWDVIAETLGMDADSSAFDPELRQEISDALSSCTFLYDVPEGCR